MPFSIKSTHKFTRQHPDAKSVKPTQSKPDSLLSDEDYLFKNLGIKTPMFSSSQSQTAPKPKARKHMAKGMSMKQSALAREDFY